MLLLINPVSRISIPITGHLQNGTKAIVPTYSSPNPTQLLASSLPRVGVHTISSIQVCSPSAELLTDMLGSFLTIDKLKDFQFPEQDLFIEYFHHRWQPVS
jgi:hypothetical protein